MRGFATENSKHILEKIQVNWSNVENNISVDEGSIFKWDITFMAIIIDYLVESWFPPVLPVETSLMLNFQMDLLVKFLPNPVEIPVKYLSLLAIKYGLLYDCLGIGIGIIYMFCTLFNFLLDFFDFICV